jgi:hypothetical protein
MDNSKLKSGQKSNQKRGQNSTDYLSTSEEDDEHTALFTNYHDSSDSLELFGLGGVNNQKKGP